MLGNKGGIFLEDDCTRIFSKIGGGTRAPRVYLNGQSPLPLKPLTSLSKWLLHYIVILDSSCFLQLVYIRVRVTRPNNVKCPMPLCSQIRP